MGTGSRGDLKILAIVLIVASAFVLITYMVGGHVVTEVRHALEPGIGFRDAAKWSFGTTVVLFILFAIAAGDGLLGELQYMLLGFFAFFVIIMLLISWVF